ncbi:MAG: type I-U CRISPR-associated protein Cas5/Cas6 [Desulfobacteraceae bacterium]|nr:MAG: type I-U CRISPR-associated protein Cas5/Cas6 [Desulfobacteraceae bacterium]
MMFGLCIHYLNGWAMAAADGARKERAEWPPHPDRVFMALSAAWFETGQDEQEEESLKWLERLPSPGIAATGAEIRREMKSDSPVISYVPVNDTALAKKAPDTHDFIKIKEAGLNLLPEHRLRQPRKFPVAIPHAPIIHLVWQEKIPEKYQKPLNSLCRKVVSIGHSASLVQMWLNDNPPSPNLLPVDGVALHRLRVFGPGRLDYLINRCNKDEVIRHRDLSAALLQFQEQKKEIAMKKKAVLKGLTGGDKKQAGEPFQLELKAVDSVIDACQSELKEFAGRTPNSLRPEPGLWQGYARPPEPARPDQPKSLFDEHLVIMGMSGKRLNLGSTLKLTGAIRGALLSACREPIPEWVSGHRPDGTRSFDPHLAFIPLPFVGSCHADGRILGVALAVPRIVDKKDAGRILESWLRDENGLPRSIKLFDGQWLECMIELETRETPPWNLRNGPWVKSSRTWASVTPVVLDRHFDGKDKWDLAADVVQDACERIGLPRPERVLLHPVSLVEGAPHSRDFPPIKRKSDNGRMHHCHAVISFQEPVTGPVIVGAGRFRGYGLCRPMEQGGGNYA